MKFTTFSKKKNNQLKEPMFFGQSVNISRYDQQKYIIFEKITEKQLSFFWRPEEIDLSKDRIDFQNLSKNEKHIFLSNLKYQTLLDSIQGRSPNIAFLPIVSIPELETWIQTWSFSETIHSRSYTHIIRNITHYPSSIFNDIVDNENISLRAKDIAKYYDELIYLNAYWNLFGEGQHILNNKKKKITLKKLKKKLYLCLISVNALEAIRFYVSFACSFAFAEREIMEGNAKIIKLIARDEALHLTGTQHMLNIFYNEKNEKMYKTSLKYKKEAYKIFLIVAEQEKNWAKYLFKNGSMLGLNQKIICQYIEYITNIRMQAIGLKPYFKTSSNPIPWINSWLISDNVQVAPQEVETTSYLVGQINSNISKKDFKNFKL
ncbi:class Ia ribonucleoside-diphosphate reductase subunit beta [Buchnera aphidicola]|uniref:class Ia ribonucleoside-diphosphate reductase subunit beta n=1 Tax=Buchnera aphidicola TaxID=9 RepID=UPI002091FC6E|nr:class Ia ribonucleoside-diphosphate reductase subunit beta [Buchnera aphidicola]USS94256.1 ribonucleotide-diphosphate reductase subunit beta [Buchnera aphidicola (Sipha maydis)]WII23805.1 ribonucleotide-diphosphate reductase subunit beta [Buchnera aphidicola (Sipha maydis)]